MNLFMLVLTVGVALASAYFSLTYYSIAADHTSDQSLEFWRAMVATLPGFLAIACALMVAQKNITIKIIDAYLAMLKECSFIILNCCRVRAPKLFKVPRYGIHGYRFGNKVISRCNIVLFTVYFLPFT